MTDRRVRITRSTERLRKVSDDLFSSLETEAQDGTALLEARAAALATPIQRPPEDELDVVLFALKGERFALELSFLSEALRLRTLSILPVSLRPALGVSTARGELVTVLDVPELLGLKASGMTDQGGLIVLEGDSGRLAVLADRVDGVAKVRPAELIPANQTPWGDQPLIVGVTPDGVTLLDAEHLISTLHSEKSRGLDDK